MKTQGMFFLIVLSLCACKSDKTIKPQDYDGEYPYVKRTNQPISTYQSKFISSWQVPPTVPIATPTLAIGQYSFMFKDHAWNHWPYINVVFRLTNNPSPPFDRIGKSILGVSIAAMSDYNCTMESVNFIVPSKAGNYRFGHELDYDSTNPSFQNIDCDALKDQVVAQVTADNWINISRLDTINNHVEGSFDLSFNVSRKDTTYSIVYPTNIRMRGNFSGPFQKR